MRAQKKRRFKKGDGHGRSIYTQTAGEQRRMGGSMGAWVHGRMGGAKGEGGREGRKRRYGVDVYFFFVLKKKICMHVQEKEYI